VALRLVTAKCSRTHDLLLEAGATRTGMIMLGVVMAGRRSGHGDGAAKDMGISLYFRVFSASSR
jgi:hypothetical protein